MTTCERRIHTPAHSRIRVRAINRTSVQLQSVDTTSCAIALFAWLAGALHRANALFICRMREMEFNIMGIIGVTYAFFAYLRQPRRFDPPFAQIAPVQMQMTPPRTPAPLPVNRC
jgi:hypothetical protein